MTQGYRYDPKAWGDDLDEVPHRDIDHLDLEHDTLGLVSEVVQDWEHQDMMERMYPDGVPPLGGY